MGNNILNVSVNIGDTSIKHFSSFTLEQKFNEHHRFELRFDHDLIEEQGMASLSNSKNFMGKNITVDFGYKGGNQQVFVGKVTRVEFAQSHGYQGDLIVSGFSPTILLEHGPDLGSYLNKNLKTIIQNAAKQAASNDLKTKINPTRTDVIDYIIQYRESDFDFINRLSAEYHEWFFYDGTYLNFGKPDKLKEVDLVYGRNLQNLHYALQIAPLQYTKFAYNPKKDEILSSDGKGALTGTADMKFAIAASNDAYGKPYKQPLPVRVNSQKDIDDYVQNEQKAVMSDLVRVSGSGDEPLVSLGSLANIKMSLREQADFNVHDFGKFLVTSVFHHIDGMGHYYNTFEGVAADTERMPVYNANKPFPDIQIATVTDNDDPDKQGRIKVKFNWKSNTNDDTEWLRIITPSAGCDDEGGSNRGFFAIPEKNDQVLIAFEEGNIARPVVMGSIYHTNNGNSQKQQDNHLKSLSTRSGHLIEFDDSSDKQGIKITDRKGNVINIDTKGNNITITALENMTLNAKNMQINVTEKMDVKAADITINASKTIEAQGTTSVKIESKEVDVQGSSTVKVSGTTVDIEGSNSAKVAGGQLDLEGQSMANLKGPTVNIN
jgi:type VI secretion system secreted protein VgrG